MRRSRTHYTDAFKRQVVAEWEAGSTPTEIADKHGLYKTAIYKWRDDLKGGIIKSSPVVHEDSQVRRYRDALREQVIATALAEYKARTGIEL